MRDASPSEPQEPDDCRDKHVAVEAGRGQAFRRRYPIIWWTTLLGPFVLTLLILLLVLIVAGEKTAWRLLGTAAATFLFFGRFVILGGHNPDAGPQVFFSPGQLFFMVTYMDLAVASLLVFHAGLLYKIPWIGTRLVALVEDGQFILKIHPWMRRATFVGLAAFVMFPLAATGAVGGSIFGRLLGLTRRAAVAGVAVGSILGNAGMYFCAGAINRYIDRDNPLLVAGGIAFIAAIILILNYRYRQIKAERGQRRGL